MPKPRTDERLAEIHRQVMTYAQECDNMILADLAEELLDEIDRLRKLTDPILAAWTDPGPNPVFHHYMQQKLHSEWPTLADAVEAAVTS